MMDWSTVTIALFSLFTGAVIPYLYSFFKNKKTKLDMETKELLEKQQATLEQIRDSQLKQANIHGLNPQDIACKDDINQLLEQLRQEVGATRVTVWAFHNGSYFTTGNPQRRLTTVFEAMTHNHMIKSEYDLLRSELLNGFASILKQLLIPAGQNLGGAVVSYGKIAYNPCEHCIFDNKCILPPKFRPKYCFLKCDVDCISIGTKFFRLMKDLGTKIFWGNVLGDEDGMPMGVITIQFNEDNETAHRLLENHSKLLCEKISQVKNSLKNLQSLN